MLGGLPAGVGLRVGEVGGRRGAGDGVRVAPPDLTISRTEAPRPHDGALVVAHTFGRGQTLRSFLLTGFALDLRDVFPS